MKKTILMVCIMSVITLVSIAQNNANTEQKKEKSTEVFVYTCPMHPEIYTDKPGKCPKCEMNLQKKETLMYTCSMHPEVISPTTGKCPKCGMKLEPRQLSGYSCAMHPEVTSEKKGKCPICGMKLVKNEIPEKHNMDQMNNNMNMDHSGHHM